MVLQALIAAGQDPEGTGWSQDGNSVTDALAVDPGADGGFAYPARPRTRSRPARFRRPSFASPTPARYTRRAVEACRRSNAEADHQPSPEANAQADGSIDRSTDGEADRSTDGLLRPPRPTGQSRACEHDGPTLTPVPTAVPTESTTPTAQVEGATFVADSPAPGPSGGSAPPVLLYGAAALLGLVVVLGGAGSTSPAVGAVDAPPGAAPAVAIWRRSLRSRRWCQDRHPPAPPRARTTSALLVEHGDGSVVTAASPFRRELPSRA